jgi:flagellar basal-body rod protein FlgB
MADNLVQNLLVNGSDPMVTLKKALEATSTRQKAHAQNIANAETPGYKRVAVGFEDQLKDVLEGQNLGGMARTDPRHMTGAGASSLAALTPSVTEEEPDGTSPGINGVNIDQEMAEMAETQIRYLASVELLKRRYTGLKMAIKGQ